MSGDRVFSATALPQASYARHRPLDGRNTRHSRKVTESHALEKRQSQPSDMPSNVSKRIGAARIPVLRVIGERADSAGIQNNGQKSHKAKKGVSAYQKRSLSLEV
jgi:hypothetical protein